MLFDNTVLLLFQTAFNGNVWRILLTSHQPDCLYGFIVVKIPYDWTVIISLKPLTEMLRMVISKEGAHSGSGLLYQKQWLLSAGEEEG